MARLRLAFARLAQETNSFSPVRTTLKDFEVLHFVEGDEVLSHCEKGRFEVGSYYKNVELSGFMEEVRRDGNIDALPLISAWAVPAGPLTLPTFEDLIGRLLGHLEGLGSVDGLYLCLHGAMGVVGVEDPEAVILRRCREVIGTTPIVVSLDLHANLTRAKVELADLIVGYRTNPHRDMRATGRRGCLRLAQLVRKQIEPVMSWRKLPMIQGGGTTVDFLQPMRSIFRRARSVEREPGVLEASVFLCHPFLDAPDVGWSTLVVTDGQPQRAEAVSEELAERCWKVRDVPMPDTIGLDSLVQEVHAAKWARRTGTVIACDTGDAVGAGGTGESTWILRTLLEEGPDLVSYIPIRDAGALQRLSEVPEGSTCAIRVGGNLDPECHPPVLVEGVSAGVVSHPYYGRFGLLRHRGVHVVITEVPWPVYTPRFYGVVGLSVWRADLVVVKNFFPFRIRFAASNRKTLLVATPGVTCWDFASLPFQRVSRPLHPLDSVQDWRPHPSMSTGEPREGRIESFL